MTDFLTELREIQIPEDIIHRIATHFRGSPIYVRKTNDTAIAFRNTNIYREFNGKNMRHICQKYDLSAQHIHRIIKAEQHKHQHDLFT